MDNISVNCSLCDEPLKPETFKDWAVGPNFQITYKCPSSSSVLTHSSLEIMMPGEDVLFFYLPIMIKDKFFDLESRLHSLVPGSVPFTTLGAWTLVPHKTDPSPTRFTERFTKLVTVSRSYKIDLKRDLRIQAVEIYDKLKPLVVFT
jgi:hypothetical protein